jgi:KipI family sensor histidine kinase inhibitor
MTETRLLASGDTVLVMEFGDTIDWRISRRVNALDRRLRRAPIAGVVETVPTFRSLAVHYDPDTISFDALGEQLWAMAEAAEAGEDRARLWRIPGCYDPDFGHDLAAVGKQAGLTPDQVIECHASHAYVVYMMGFLPGFPYMGNVPDAIALPRLETPRTRVPQGSIAIATSMTAVYTLESPGGWHILGRTPISFFDINARSPALLSPGDKVVFEPVSRAAFENISVRVKAGQYALTPEEVSA